MTSSTDSVIQNALKWNCRDVIIVTDVACNHIRDIYYSHLLWLNGSYSSSLFFLYTFCIHSFHTPSSSANISPPATNSISIYDGTCNAHTETFNEMYLSHLLYLSRFPSQPILFSFCYSNNFSSCIFGLKHNTHNCMMIFFIILLVVNALWVCVDVSNHISFSFCFLFIYSLMWI